jgi:hypothetical protein
MSQYKYEINERKLKRNLKDNEVPFSEDAWLKFENFYASQALINNASGAKFNKFSLNSNLTLPIVFGSVITAFVLLLVNFVNIKKPTATSDAPVKSEPVVLIQPTPLQKNDQTPTETKAEVKHEVSRNTVVATNQQPITTIPSEPANIIAPAYKPLIAVRKRDIVSDSAGIKAEIPNITIVADKNTTTNTAEPRRTNDNQKKKKTQSIVGEPSSEEDEQVPPPMTQSAASTSVNFH